MRTYYLKAADEATFNQALIDAGWKWEEEVDSDGNVTKEAGEQYWTSTHSLDIIGIINAETGVMITPDPESDGSTYPPYPEMAPVEGWHANLRLHGEPMPESLKPFLVAEPSTPVRGFF